MARSSPILACLSIAKLSKAWLCKVQLGKFTATKKHKANALCFLLVGTIGVEPMTSCMSSMRSNQLSYAPVPDYFITIFCKKQ